MYKMNYIRRFYNPEKTVTTISTTLMLVVLSSNHHCILLILQETYLILRFLRPFRNHQSDLSGRLVLLKLEDLRWRCPAELKYWKRRNSVASEGAIKIFLFTFHVLHVHVLRSRYDPLVVIGVFYISKMHFCHREPLGVYRWCQTRIPEWSKTGVEYTEAVVLLAMGRGDPPAVGVQTAETGQFWSRQVQKHKPLRFGWRNLDQCLSTHTFSRVCLDPLVPISGSDFHVGYLW